MMVVIDVIIIGSPNVVPTNVVVVVVVIVRGALR